MLLVKLVEPPCTERYARWCERSAVYWPPPTRLYGEQVILVGSNFAGLSGAALTSACLAYIGRGAIAAGGAGMLGGTITIVGGGALLGVGIGAGVGGTFGALSLMDKKGTILQSAKLLVSVREIFLNDEHDMEYSNYIYEQYVNKLADIEKSFVELKLKAETASKDEQKTERQ